MTRRRRLGLVAAPVAGARNRLLQLLALYAPGAETVRVWLHRRRGVAIGDGTFIGTSVLIETSLPHLVSIGERVNIGIRAVIIAHFHGAGRHDRDGDGKPTVVIEDDVHIGPGTIVLPNVRLGAGAVVGAGSVVTRSVPPLTLVQGNPAKPVARSRRPLSYDISIKEYYSQLRPL